MVEGRLWLLEAKEEQLNELFEIFEEFEYIRNDVAAVEYEYVTQLKVDSTRMDITITLRCPHTFPLEPPAISVGEQYSHTYLNNGKFNHQIFVNWDTNNTKLIDIMRAFLEEMEKEPLKRRQLQGDMNPPKAIDQTLVSQSPLQRENIKLEEEVKKLKYEKEELEKKVKDLKAEKEGMFEHLTQSGIKEMEGEEVDDLLQLLLPFSMFEDTREQGKGQNTVYFYRNKITNEKVAIKIFSNSIDEQEAEKNKKQAKDEFKTMLRCLRSEHTVKPISLGINNKYIGLLMEFGGKPLDNFWKESMKDDIYIIAYLQLAKGLQFFESQNIYHGDIKPQNILVKYTYINPESEGPKRVDEKNIKFQYIDFGAAMHFESTEKFLDTILTKPKIRQWTMLYMPPEIIWTMLGKVQPIRPKYRQIDIYSLGLTMYSFLIKDFPERNLGALKKEPVNYEKFMTIIEQHLDSRLKKMEREKGNALKHIIMRSLDQNPSGRCTIEEIISTFTPFL